MTTWTTVTPLADEPEQRSYWEPWEPKFGDRVRVRLSGECRLEGLTRDGPDSEVRRGSAHPSYQEGIEGTVRECEAKCRWHGERSEGHHLRVDYLKDGWPHFGHFAACELEPLEEA